MNSPIYYLIKLRCFVPETRSDRFSAIRPKYAFYYIQAYGEDYASAQSVVNNLLDLVNADWTGVKGYKWNAVHWTRSNIASMPYSIYYQAALPVVN